MGIQLQIVQDADMAQFKHDMQEAFQKGAEAEFGNITEQILPESHINASLIKSGSVAYAAVEDGRIVGGAIVQIDSQTHRNHLDFLYVKCGVQSRGGRTSNLGCNRAAAPGNYDLGNRYPLFRETQYPLLCEQVRLPYR